MSYLRQYDAVPLTKPQEKMALVIRWLQSVDDWQPFFQELRHERPIFVTPAFTFVTRFKDVEEVLAHHTTFSVEPYAKKIDPVVGPFMLGRDGTALNWREKSIMKTMLLPEDLPKVRALAGQYAEESLQRECVAGKIEVVSKLGRLVPVRLCESYFGFPGPDRETMLRWSKTTQTDMFRNLRKIQADDASVQVGEEMKECLGKLLDSKRQTLKQSDLSGSREHDVFTRLLLTHFAPPIPFDDERIIANMMGLLIGAVETTSQAIVQALEQIMLRPEVLVEARRVAREGSDLEFDPYVWEALRFNPMAPLVVRRCEADYILAAGTERETVIAKGTLVFACMGSAMFDERELKDPEKFRTGRPAYHTMHFGFGAHTCLGKHLGMVIIPEVIKHVLLYPGTALLPGEEGKIIVAPSRFPERFFIACGSQTKSGKPTRSILGMITHALLGDRDQTPPQNTQERSTTPRGVAARGSQDTLESLLTQFPTLWKALQQIPFLNTRVNQLLINSAVQRITPRPHPLSTMSCFTSWDSLTDRTYYGRHLPPHRDANTLPPVEEVVKLFQRDPARPIVSSKSTLLFAYFAQWFTDGFLRTDRSNLLKNTSNHEIDLSPLYGLHPRYTRMLRSGVGGKLKSQFIKGEEYPCYYHNPSGSPKLEFADLPLVIHPDMPPERLPTLFAMGGDRGNVQVGYIILNTLFLREHNRICDCLTQHPENAGWDDERLFHTARNILLVILLNLVIREYINHISPYHFKFFVEPNAFANAPWFRTNWICVEFNLLYRWHSLVPDQIRLKGVMRPLEYTLWNTQDIVEQGLGACFEEATMQPAGEIGLFNTGKSLEEAEVASIKLGRLAQLGTYNDYREHCGLHRVTAFDQISTRPEVQRELDHIYGHVDNIEFYPGLFAEDVRKDAVLGPLIGRLVAADAFSQALTNPLLAPNVYNKDTFSEAGLQIIEETHSLSDILHRNVPQKDKHFNVSLTKLDWRHS